MSNFKIKYGSQGGKKSIFVKQPKTTKIDYPGEPNLEVDTEVELNELQKQFREKAKKEAELKEKNTSSEYWSCIIFENQEQRDSLYELLGLRESDNQYINGKKLIRALELKIAEINEKAPGKFKCNKELLELSMKP
jgi:hypothetical protein